MTTKKVENAPLQAIFEVEETLTQGLMERFEAQLDKDDAKGIRLKTTHGKYLRAAIMVGWVKSGPLMNPDQIVQADPRVVALIGGYLLTEYNQASIIPNA
jgi:hypothetical protein